MHFRIPQRTTRQCSYDEIPCIATEYCGLSGCPASHDLAWEALVLGIEPSRGVSQARSDLCAQCTTPPRKRQSHDVVNSYREARHRSAHALTDAPHLCRQRAGGHAKQHHWVQWCFFVGNSVSTKMQMTAIPDNDKLMFMHL